MTGTAIATRIAIIRMTIMSSIRVKPAWVPRSLFITFTPFQHEYSPFLVIVGHFSSINDRVSTSILHLLKIPGLMPKNKKAGGSRRTRS